jgi:hypothetical protein
MWQCNMGFVQIIFPPYIKGKSVLKPPHDEQRREATPRNGEFALDGSPTNAAKTRHIAHNMSMSKSTKS